MAALHRTVLARITAKPLRFRCDAHLSPRRVFSTTPQPHTEQRHKRSYYTATATAAVTLLGFAAVYSHNDTAADDATDTQHTQSHTDHRHGHADPIRADIPHTAPDWVQALSGNPHYMYQNLQRLLDTTGHMIFDSLLHSPAGIERFYYFAEIPPYLREQQTDSQTLMDAVVSKIQSNTPAGSEHHTDTPTTTAPQLQRRVSRELAEWTPEIRAVFHLGDAVCGHKGVVHGGMSATLMDEVSGCAAFMSVGPAFTASLNVDYCKPLPANTWVLVRAKVVSTKGRKSYVAATIEDGHGTVYARSAALFVKPKLLTMPPSALFAAVQ